MYREDDDGLQCGPDISDYLALSIRIEYYEKIQVIQLNFILPERECTKVLCDSIQKLFGFRRS